MVSKITPAYERKIDETMSKCSQAMGSNSKMVKRFSNMLLSFILTTQTFIYTMSRGALILFIHFKKEIHLIKLANRFSPRTLEYMDVPHSL
jgi:hypothetical protein